MLERSDMSDPRAYCLLQLPWTLELVPTRPTPVRTCTPALASLAARLPAGMLFASARAWVPNIRDVDSGESSSAYPVEDARRAISYLLDNGYIDERHATVALLALDLGRRQVQRQSRHSAWQWPKQ
jgi:hypothetical protein